MRVFEPSIRHPFCFRIILAAAWICAAAVNGCHEITAPAGTAQDPLVANSFGAKRGVVSSGIGVNHMDSGIIWCGRVLDDARI